jgi:predicted DCC family thiol-disulfide oxidoreductase YuxK
MLEPARNIILFDGVCNFCNSAVQFLIKQDKHAVFKFASLQSETANALLRNHQMDRKGLTTLIYIKENKVYIQSDAILKICLMLGGIWQLLYVFIIVPKFIRDYAYLFFANRRYKWYGKRTVCNLETNKSNSRFL